MRPAQRDGGSRPCRGGSTGRVLAGFPLVLVHSAGRWFALDDECTHTGCALSEDGELVDGVLICNCHGAEFEAATGALLEGPAETPLEIHAVRIVEGRVEVEI